MKCENCEIGHQGLYGSGRFCSSKCARSFSTKEKREEINKKVSTSLKGRPSPFKGIIKTTKTLRKYVPKPENSIRFKDRDKYNAYMKEYMLKAYHKKKLKIIKLLGNKCFKCETTENLQVDHINPNKKEFNIAKIWSYSWSKINNELNKCQLLCEDCHLKKSKMEGSFTKGWVTKPRLIHGSLWTYSHHKCRCNVCIESYKNHLKLRKQKHKVKMNNVG